MDAANLKRDGSINKPIYVNLKRELTYGRLRPEEYLRDKEIAKAFGVSKTPIRETLVDLVKERIIQLWPRKGRWSAPIDCCEVKDNIELFVILECAAVELAGKRITKQKLNSLERLILPQSPSGTPLDNHLEIETRGHNHIEFRKLTAVSSGNWSLARAISKVLEELTRAIFVYYSSQTIDEHADLIDALSRRDAAEARKIFTSHLEVTWNNLLRMFLGQADKIRVSPVNFCQ